MSLEEFRAISPVFEEDIYDAISMKTCVETRNTIGAPGFEAMTKVLEIQKKYLEDSDNIFRAAIIPLSPRKPPGQCPRGLFHSQFINLQTLDVVSSLYFLISHKGLERCLQRRCL